MATMASRRVLVIEIKNLSLSNYLDEVYLYLVGFINKMKETNITRNIHLILKFMLKSTKDVDEEIEMFLKSKNTTVTVRRSTSELD